MCHSKPPKHVFQTHCVVFGSSLWYEVWSTRDGGHLDWKLSVGVYEKKNTVLSTNTHKMKGICHIQ